MDSSRLLRLTQGPTRAQASAADVGLPRHVLFGDARPLRVDSEHPRQEFSPLLIGGT